jgi:phage I-like protein
VWHDVNVPDESHSERLRRESDELLETAAKLIEHAATLKAQAAELKKQVARLEQNAKPTRKRAWEAVPATAVSNIERTRFETLG